MKKKCRLLSITLIVLLFPFLKSNGQAQSVTFTTPSFAYIYPIPANYNYNYSYSQSIYMPYLFNITAGNITRIMYYWNGGTAGTNNDLTNSNVWTIYMGHRTDSTITSVAGWLPLDSLTQVFSDTIQVSSPGWMSIELETPFPYNSSQGNLVIAVDENAPGLSYPSPITNTGFRSGSRWGSTNYKTLYRYNNITNMAPAAPGNGSRTQFVNHIMMDIDPSTSLPITLKEFHAENAGSRNLLYWTSATENPGDTYIVERSADGKLFTETGRMDARSTPDMTYHFTDEAPFAGISYYRLRLRNKDGKIHFSTVVHATVKQGGFQARLYPNPAKDKVTVAVTGPSGIAHIQVCDLLGRPFKTITPDQTGNTIINIDFLPAGTYFIKYKDDTHFKTLKLVKE
jgi:hypothetical protein